MSKIEKKVTRRIGHRIHNHNVDGANDFIKYICGQGFITRLDVAWSIIKGKPIKLEKVVM
jgi:hypothetical protein